MEVGWGVLDHLGQTKFAEICILVTKYISKLNSIQITFHVRRYGDSVDNTIEENSSFFSLILMR